MSGMSYSVQLDDEPKRKIIAWGLPKEGISAILQRMDELREMPSRNLLRIETSSHPLQTDVVYRDPGPPARDCLIVLYVRYSVDEETLNVVDCERWFDDQLA
jgi:hypothetical protein